MRHFPFPFPFPFYYENSYSYRVRFPFSAPETPSKCIATHIHTYRKIKPKVGNSRTRQATVSTCQEVGGLIPHWEKQAKQSARARMMASRQTLGKPLTSKRGRLPANKLPNPKTSASAQTRMRLANIQAVSSDVRKEQVKPSVSIFFILSCPA